jgi:hypothetical protein
MLAFFLPFILLLVAIASPEAVRWRTMAYTMAPAAVALALSMVFHGGSAQVSAICAFLGSSGPATCASRGAIRYLEVGFQDSVREIYYALLTWPRMVTTAGMSFVLGALPFALIAKDDSAALRLWQTFSARWVSCLALAASFAPLPLFIVGGDWGRWIYTILTSWTILVAFALGRGWEGPEAAGLPERKPAGGHSVPRWAAILLLLMYALVWNARGVCCPERLGNGLLGRIIPLWPPWPGRCGGGADCSTADRADAMPRTIRQSSSLTQLRGFLWVDEKRSLTHKMHHRGP